MNFNRVSSKVSNSFVMDPYATLMHYRRSFKLLKQLNERKSPILAIGNKNQSGFDWKNNFDGIQQTGMNDSVLATAAKNYHLILCFDPVLFALSLQNLHLPIMVVATAQELAQYPEILQVTDYLLPAPTGRADAALRQLVFSEVLAEDQAFAK